MFNKLSIKAEYDVSIRKLIKLHKEGHPVFRTSHAGNWSSYKLLLSELGLPDHIWEVTCIHKDINNQPQVQIIEGKKIPLLDSPPPKPINGTKHLTPYQRCTDKKQTLSSFHIAPLKKMFGDTITTISETLLEYEDNMKTVFQIVQNHCPKQIGRYILPCGCMTTLKKDGDTEAYKASCEHGNNANIKVEELAESALKTLKELKSLVFNPVNYIPKGGALYSLELVVASTFLKSYWKYGNKTIYMLSGPDMIKYATKKSFVKGVQKILRIVGNHSPFLVPENIDVRIVPTALFKFGYPHDSDVSKRVMSAHETIWKLQEQKKKYSNVPKIVTTIETELLNLTEIVKKEGAKWNIFHNPSKDAFYSQHDLCKSNSKMTVSEHYLNLPFSEVDKVLHTLEQTEQSVSIQLFSGK